MSVSQVQSSPYLSDYEQTNMPKSVLGKDDFLKLMMTQLKYQDPLQPMDNTEHIAQMAQFTTLEQLTNMAQSFDRMQAFNLVGKTVKALSIDQSGNLAETVGKVESAAIYAGGVLLIVDGAEFSLNQICEVIEENDQAD